MKYFLVTDKNHALPNKGNIACKEGYTIYNIKQLPKALHYNQYFIREVKIPQNTEISNLGNYHTTNNVFIISKRELWTVKTFKFLIKQGMNICEGNDLIFRSAVYRNKRNLVEFLLNNGANIHVNNEETLRYTAQKGRYQMTKLLIKYGANVNAENSKPLSNAIMHYRPKTIKLLIKHGANIETLEKFQKEYIKNLLSFKVKYQYNLSKEDITPSTTNQYLNWAQKRILS